MQRANPVARLRSTDGGGWGGRLGWTAISLLGFLAFWELMALIIQSRHLPGPIVVVQAMMGELINGQLGFHVGITLLRVAAAFVIAMSIGSAIGILLGRFERADKFFDSWVILFLNLPALVIIILCYVWFGRTEVAAITAVAINKIPNVTVTIREGTRSLSRDLAEMAAMYRFGWLRTLRHVTLPQLAPFFLASARTGLSLVWKIVLVVELLGRSDGVGFQLGTYFQMFDVSMILAYALAFIIVVQIIEFGVLQPIAQRVNRWRLVTEARTVPRQGAGALSIRVERKTFPAVADSELQTVLQNILIDIEPRSFVVITGPSGGGKSTLLNIVAGLDNDYQGEVTFSDPASVVGYIFQSPRLLPWRTVEQNIALALPEGDPKLALIPEMLRQVGLEAAASQYPERISLGMQRRAALARGFITEPDILLMDEPFVSLDDPTARGLREVLIELWNRRPTTVLFVTHDRTEAVMLGTRILRLAGPGATIVQDEAVRLTPGERTDPEKVLAEQKRIFRDT